MIFLDFKDRRPLYEQITEKYKELIMSGALTADEKLPSVRALAAELCVTPNTVQRAYTELEKEDFIYTVKGRGNFVSSNDTLLLQNRKQKLELLQRDLQLAKQAGCGKQDILRILDTIYGGDDYAAD